MSGRGNLLSLFNKKTEPAKNVQFSQEHTNDSGLDADQSNLSGVYKKTDRDTTTCDLASTCNNPNISIGRGRANLLHSIKKETIKSDLLSSLEGIASQDANSDNTNNQCILKNGLFYPNMIYGSKGTYNVLDDYIFSCSTKLNKYRSCFY